MVVSNIFYVHPYLGKISYFDEHIFPRGWFNHQLDQYQDQSNPFVYTKKTPLDFEKPEKLDRPWILHGLTSA